LAKDAMARNPQRQAVEDYLQRHLTGIDPTGTNAKRYAAAFAKMNDAEFHKFVDEIRTGVRTLKLYTPNMVVRLRLENIVAVAKAIECKLFQRLKLWDPNARRFYLTPRRYPIFLLPVRRLKQYLQDKMSVPESDTTTDLFTGQVVRPDKGSSISTTEMQTYASKGLTNALVELTNVRGGNVTAYAAFKAQLEETGSAQLGTTAPTGKIRSAVMGQVFLQSMMLDNNLAGGPTPE
jgi:hypothetical protein